VPVAVSSQEKILEASGKAEKELEIPGECQRETAINTKE
jgi:hypothetical protein